MCYHAEFGRSALQDVGINIGEPPKLSSAGILPLKMGAWLTPSPFPVCVTTSNLVVLRQRVYA